MMLENLQNGYKYGNETKSTAFFFFSWVVNIEILQIFLQPTMFMKAVWGTGSFAIVALRVQSHSTEDLGSVLIIRGHLQFLSLCRTEHLVALIKLNSLGFAQEDTGSLLPSQLLFKLQRLRLMTIWIRDFSFGGVLGIQVRNISKNLLPFFIWTVLSLSLSQQETNMMNGCLWVPSCWSPNMQ